MRYYQKEQELAKVVCNRCGKELAVKDGYLREGCFSADQVFGYFSSRDGARHRFDLCETCYQEWIDSFLLPVEESLETELV